jgi:sugar-specific transcriptional regulator TrmB
MSDKEDNADARSKILDELEYLGLTHYEAELFLTLSLRGMTARELAQTTEIPYTKVYAVLEKLNQLNLVQRVSSSPSLFSIPEPDIVIGVLCDEVRSRIDEIEGHITNYLASVRRNVNKSDDLNMSWNIVGSSKVRYYLQTMVKKARRSIYVMDPGIRTVDSKLHEIIKSKTDVQLKMIFSSSDLKEIPEDLIPFSRISDRLNSRYYVFDNETSFMISTEKDHEIYGIVEPCSNCVLQSREHFEMMWDRSRPAAQKDDSS